MTATEPTQDKVQPIYELPMFDGTKAALVFAFNATEAFITSPTMNTMMAATPGDYKANVDQPSEPRGPVQPGHKLRGLNKAAQAGFILHQVGRLDAVHQNILRARLTTAKQPCACGSTCCRGYKVHYHWGLAMDALRYYLANDASLVPAKKGMSTHVNLRDAVLKRYFHYGRYRSNNRLSEELDMSPMTVAKHATLLEDCLLGLENEAWHQIDAIFDQHGVTGFIE